MAGPDRATARQLYLLVPGAFSEQASWARVIAPQDMGERHPPSAPRSSRVPKESRMTEQHEFWPDGARLTVSVSMQFEAGGQPISGPRGPTPAPILHGF